MEDLAKKEKNGEVETRGEREKKSKGRKGGRMKRVEMREEEKKEKTMMQKRRKKGNRRNRVQKKRTE